MREVSELIYETCKTYLLTQGKFLFILWLFIGAIIVVYFGFLATTPTRPPAVEHGFPPDRSRSSCSSASSASSAATGWRGSASG